MQQQGDAQRLVEQPAQRGLQGSEVEVGRGAREAPGPMRLAEGGLVCHSIAIYAAPTPACKC